MDEEERKTLLEILTADLTATEKLVLVYVIMCDKYRATSVELGKIAGVSEHSVGGILERLKNKHVIYTYREWDSTLGRIKRNIIVSKIPKKVDD